MIGALGPIVFSVSEDQVKTFRNLSRTESARWAKHDVIGKKPKSEFLGPDLSKVSFKIRFDVMHGMNPRKELDSLIALVREGKPHRLVIGGKALGVNKWSIQNVSQDWKHLDNKGNVLIADATLDLEEYVDD